MNASFVLFGINGGLYLTTSETNSFLVKEKLGTLMKRYSIPCIISLLVAALYNIVDQIFIANADYLGSYGNAANTVVFPLTIVALALAVLIGDGCCAYVSISLGSKKHEAANRSVGNSIVLCLLISLLLTFIYSIFRDQILALFGGKVNEATFSYAKEYFSWITLGIPFYIFGQAMNPIIRSDGSPKFAMVSTLSGAILNIILDPLFIFGFHWGMMGATLATIIGQALTAGLAIGYLFKMKSVRLNFQSFKLKTDLIFKFLPLGICSFLSQISLVASMACVNNMLSQYSALDPIFSSLEYAQIPMAVVGIVMKVFQIVISIVVGMAAGCIPIVGYNMGAGRKDRALKLFKLLLLNETIVGLIALIIVECFPQQLIAIFGSANESIYYTEFAIKSFRIYLSMLILACLNKATFIYLQSLGKAFVSTLLSMVREILFGVGLTLLLPIMFGLDGVLYSMPLADILTFILTVIIIITTTKSLKNTRDERVLLEN